MSGSPSRMEVSGQEQPKFMSQEELLEQMKVQDTLQLEMQEPNPEEVCTGVDAPAIMAQKALVAPDGGADEEEDNDDDDGWESPEDPFPTEPRRRPTEDELDADYAPEEQGPPRSQRRRR
ncbi:unnamed protein product [Urochloa humidicola]